MGAMAQTADEIIKKHVDAVGGEDNWKKVTSVKSSGSMDVQGTPVKLTTSTIKGKGQRIDIEVMGMKNYIIVTPGKGWMYMPVQQMTEPKEMPEDQLGVYKNSLDPEIHLLTIRHVISKLPL